MLYLGIDQHARQITISLRDDSGDVLQARQVSTRPEKINEFFQKLTRERLRNGESFIAVVEVCGFNDWLIRLLRDYRCHKVILIQPEERKKRKTDRRDAAALSELLWVNRDRFLAGKPVRGLRQVDIAAQTIKKTDASPRFARRQARHGRVSSTRSSTCSDATICNGTSPPRRFPRSVPSPGSSSWSYQRSIAWR